jgi:hypothetical protein
MERRLVRAILVLTVTCAALLAHVAIDLAGDVLLAHDTYDDVAHHSRESAFLICSLLAFALLWRTVRAARAELAGRHGALRAVLRAAVPANGRGFVCGVMAGTLPALLAMAGLDAIFDGTAIDGIEDLLGGSVALGLACAFASGLAAGAIVLRAIRALARMERHILELVAIFERRARSLPAAAGLSSRERSAVRGAAMLCACSVGLRAPPLGAR